MTRRKISSKRRWIRRFMLGRLVPYTAIVEHIGLKRCLDRHGAELLPHADFVRRKALA